MISIPRPVLRNFRGLVRRAGLHKRYGTEACFSLVGSPEGCRIRAASTEVAIEYQQPGQFDAETILLPVKALDAWNGRRKEQVTLDQPYEVWFYNTVGGIIFMDDGGAPQAAWRAKAAFPSIPMSCGT